MRSVYNQLQLSFNKKYQYKKSFRTCFLRQLSYYEEL